MTLAVSSLSATPACNNFRELQKTKLQHTSTHPAIAAHAVCLKVVTSEGSSGMLSAPMLFFTISQFQDVTKHSPTHIIHDQAAINQINSCGANVAGCMYTHRWNRGTAESSTRSSSTWTASRAKCAAKMI